MSKRKIDTSKDPFFNEVAKFCRSSCDAEFIPAMMAGNNEQTLKIAFEICKEMTLDNFRLSGNIEELKKSSMYLFRQFSDIVKNPNLVTIHNDVINSFSSFVREIKDPGIISMLSEHFCDEIWAVYKTDELSDLYWTLLEKKNIGNLLIYLGPSADSESSDDVTESLMEMLNENRDRVSKILVEYLPSLSKSLGEDYMASIFAAMDQKISQEYIASYEPVTKARSEEAAVFAPAQAAHPDDVATSSYGDFRSLGIDELFKRLSSECTKTKLCSQSNKIYAEEIAKRCQGPNAKEVQSKVIDLDSADNPLVSLCRKGIFLGSPFDAAKMIIDALNRDNVEILLEKVDVVKFRSKAWKEKMPLLKSYLQERITPSCDSSQEPTELDDDVVYIPAPQLQLEVELSGGLDSDFMKALTANHPK